jgi:STAM-binding protein
VYKVEGDDEKVFTLYMRYISLFLEKVTSHPEYKTADQAEKIFARNKCKEIIPITETIKAKLKKRFEDQYRCHLVDLESKREEEERQRVQAARFKEKQEEIERTFEEEQLQNKFREAQERYANRPPDYSVESTDQFDEFSRRASHTEQPSDLSDQLASVTVAIPSAPTATPQVDRTKKPVFETSKADSSYDGLRRVIIPTNLTSQFLQAAERNTAVNIETCGILCGKISQNAFTISHVLIPKQKGTSDSCQMLNEEDICMFQDEQDLMTLGWIHTHPSQTAFMSSIDLHTHFGYQVMLSEAIAIVCAPKHDKIGLYSLTMDYGLKFIGSCRESGFHLHPKEPPIYQDCAHVSFDQNKYLQLVDLR